LRICTSILNEPINHKLTGCYYELCENDRRGT
jgi:hypothetical protein